MTFLRLRGADWVVMLAALALLFAMAADWYSTGLGDQARRLERSASPSGAEAGEPGREERQSAREEAQSQEKNAWQAPGRLDRLILVLLLATVLLAVAAGFLRAAGRRFEPPLTPSGLAALGALASGLLVAYRLVQQPGDDSVTTIKAGPPLALVALAVLMLAGARALRAEERGRAFRELPAPAEPERLAADRERAPADRERAAT